jgi:murein DD-endopeptidase MepM/ murein hydrolase activator NlpD
MADNEKNKQSFSKKLRNKYRLVILNDDTFEEKLSLRLSRLNVFVVTGLSAVLLIALTTVIIAFTPLREYIPGYSSTTLRRQAMNNAVQVDSLERRLAQNEQYIRIINGIISGNMPEYEINLPSDGVIPAESLDTEVSQQDSMLREEIAREEMYSVNRSERENEVESFVFFPPVKGIVNDVFDAQKRHFGVDVLASENEPILSVLDGTVVFASWTTEAGYVVCVQHSDNLFSVYAHNSALLKKTGDRVRGGEAVSVIGNSGHQTSGPHLHFELWYNGTAVNPTKYISF